MVFLDREQAADSDADQHADVVGIALVDLERRLAHRLLGRAHRVLDEEVHLFDVLLLDPVIGIEVAHFARDAGGEVGNVEAGDRSDTRAPGHQGFPVLLDSRAQRRDQAQAGHHHAAITDASHLSPMLLTFRRCNASILYQKAGHFYIIVPASFIDRPRQIPPRSHIDRSRARPQQLWQAADFATDRGATSSSVLATQPQ